MPSETGTHQAKREEKERERRGGGECVREKEGGRERQTERQTDRYTTRDREKQKEGERGEERER